MTRYPDHIKLCIHGGLYGCVAETSSRIGDKVDIATRTKNPSTEFLPALGRQIMSCVASPHMAIGEYISEHFPGVSPSPGITDACLYTVTHDEVLVSLAHR